MGYIRNIIPKFTIVININFFPPWVVNSILMIKRSYNNLDHMSDEELIKLYKKTGEERIFLRLYKNNSEDVYRFILSKVRDKNLAEDLHQDTFIKVLTKIKRTYSEEGKWLSWLMTVARNTVGDYRRKRKHIYDIKPFVSDRQNYFEQIKDNNPTPHDSLEYKESIEVLLKYIHQLPKAQSEVLILRFYYEMEFQEISTITNVSINTAIGRKRYALINLQKMFNESRTKQRNHIY